MKLHSLCIVPSEGRNSQLALALSCPVLPFEAAALLISTSEQRIFNLSIAFLLLTPHPHVNSFCIHCH
jgi:hypothetical protein